MHVRNEIDLRVRPWQWPSGDRTLVERRERIVRRSGALRGAVCALTGSMVGIVDED
jgi:hypothetical protein